MQVPSTTMTGLNNNTQTTPQTQTAGPSLDYSAFLRLLIAQMKNQDPTAPADPAQWMGQLASFSNVEQAIQTNAKLDALMTSMALSQGDSLIGRTLTTMEGNVTGTITSVRIYSDATVAVLDTGVEVLLGAGVIIA
ncbi:MAG TPA: flagellar hook assembly protein FlgD [Hyphomicrobium sp.]|nr:flagellar hook assembly protein FlgD [Hyphomicrobium sp.]